MKKYLNNVWLALKGELTIEKMDELRLYLKVARADASYQFGRFEEQKKRADLAAKPYKEGEVGRRAASDALGQSVIDNINKNPELFIPPKAKLLKGGE